MSTAEPKAPDQNPSPLDRVDEALHDGLIGRGRHKGLIPFFEDLVHYVVALVLLGIAVFVIFKTVHDLIVNHQSYVQAVTVAVNGVLIAIIVLEVLRTVMAHFDRGGLQPEPFLIVGIISGVRGILFRRRSPVAGSNPGAPHHRSRCGARACRQRSRGSRPVSVAGPASASVRDAGGRGPEAR